MEGAYLFLLIIILSGYLFTKNIGINILQCVIVCALFGGSQDPLYRIQIYRGYFILFRLINNHKKTDGTSECSMEFLPYFLSDVRCLPIT